MKKIYMIILAVLAAGLSGCGPENLQRSNPLDPQYNVGGEAYIEGFVKVNGGAAVNGATVSLINMNRTVLTEATGYYSFAQAPTGNISLMASAPWYQDNTQTIMVTSGERKTLDFSLDYGRLSTFPCTFDSYMLGISPPAPWQTYTSGTSLYPVVNSTFSVSPSYSCKFTCGTTIGDYSELRYSGLNAVKGIKVKAAINVISISSCSFMVKLKDASGSNGPEIGINGSDFYLKSPSGTGQNMSGSPSASTFYYVEIIYESDTGSAFYTVFNTSNTIISGPVTLNNVSKYTIDRVSVVNTAVSPTAVSAYLDDIDIIKK
ncbi:MAG: carboxypeptidase-like regulatory domain-containing protein [Candidatus Firestonebacteria bacterium]